MQSEVINNACTPTTTTTITQADPLLPELAVKTGKPWSLFWHNFCGGKNLTLTFFTVNKFGKDGFLPVIHWDWNIFIHKAKSYRHIWYMKHYIFLNKFSLLFNMLLWASWHSIDFINLSATDFIKFSTVSVLTLDASVYYIFLFVALLL